MLKFVLCASTTCNLEKYFEIWLERVCMCEREIVCSR